MKKLLSILFISSIICCSAFAVDEQMPIFEEVDENECSVCETQPFLLKESCKLEMESQNHYVSPWTRYKSNFGMEKIFVRFPCAPTISHTSSTLTAYAYDYSVLYSLMGYYPPMGRLDPIAWFDSICFTVSSYPYSLLSHSIYQLSNGDWMMDYLVRDYIQNTILKGRAVATPFNGYIFQCVKSECMGDYFNYFLDNLQIACECK